MSNIAPELKLAFSLPSNSFYGPTINNNYSFALPTPPLNMKKTTRTVFTQSSSRTIVEETLRKRRFSTDSRKSLLSLPINTKNMDGPERRNRSVSPDWATCRFSLPSGVVIKKEENKTKRVKHHEKVKKEEEESKKENRRSASPDWNTSRFSLPPFPRNFKNPGNPRSPRSPKRTSISSPKRSATRSVSPDWSTCRFSLPVTKTPQPLKTLNKKSISPRITAPLAKAFKMKTNKNIIYKISQKTLDNLLPKPEIHLFDVVKYGPTSQHKDDFLFGLNLMRSEVLNKIDLLHYKKKLRNTGMNFIRTFQQTKNSRSKGRKTNIEEIKKEPLVASIEIPDDPLPDEIIIEDDAAPEEVIQIEDEEQEDGTEQLLEEAIQDFTEKFGGEVLEEVTEKANIVESDPIINITDSNGEIAKETVKISETNTFYHSVTKKRNSLDSKLTKLNDAKRNSLPNIKNIKRNGVPKKKVSPNRKKSIIKVKWPIARKSLLDIRNK